MSVIVCVRFTIGAAIVLDGICELAARISGAPEALVYVRHPGDRKLTVLGQYGADDGWLHESWDIGTLTPGGPKVLAIADVRGSKLLRNHPVRRAVPEVRSLIAFLLSKSDEDPRMVLLVFNPHESVFTNPNDLAALRVLARTLSDLPRRFRPETIAKADEPTLGFEDSASAALTTGDHVAGHFLNSTLTQKKRLLGRKGISYIALRSWRNSIKPFQIAALTALKSNPPKGFVVVAAKEIADAARSQYGDSFIQNVVPVPCGSSGQKDCLSVQFAEEVAKLLGCKFKNVLQSSAGPGSSHPKNSAKLQPFKLTKPVHGATLVVDDVVSSGRHMELAINCLRSGGVDCFAISWIAA